MAITYDAGTNIITIDDEDADFQDITDADDAGGWGVFSVCGDSENKSYVSGAKIVLTNGAALMDSQVQIVFNSSCVSANSQKLITVESGCNLTFGTLIDAATRRTKNGISMFFKNTGNRRYTRLIEGVSGANIYLYSSFFKTIGYSQSVYAGMLRNIYNGRIWSCYLDNVYPYSCDSIDLYHITSINTLYGLGRCSVTYANDVLLHDNAYNLQFYGAQPSTLNNLVAKNPTTKQIRCDSITGDSNIVNGDFDVWTFSWVSSTGKIYRKYEFDALCIDENGEVVSGVSAVGEYVDDSEAFSDTTDENGEISTQTVDHGYFDQAHGSTEQLKTPLKVTYSKAGYQTVVKYYDLDEKTKDVVLMRPPSFCGAGHAKSNFEAGKAKGHVE